MKADGNTSAAARRQLKRQRGGAQTIRERFEAAFPRCRIDEYGEPAEICPASLAGKECPATDKPTCMNCPAWDWPAE